MEYKMIRSEREKMQFIQAWKKAFNREYADAVYTWMFGENNDLYGVFDDNQLVAGYCLLKQTIRWQGTVQIGALCNNVFVHPDYRGQNLFVKLGRYALGEAKKKASLGIGIPNENAVVGHRRVGWTFQNTIHFLQRNTKPHMFTDEPFVINLDIDNYDRYKDQLEKFSVAISSDRTFSVIKDQEYFKWRYLLKPFVDYKLFVYEESGEIKGYVVFKIYEKMKRIHVIDIEAANSHVFDALLNQVDNINDNCDLINVWESTVYADLFLKNGFVKSLETNHLIAIDLHQKGQIDLGESKNLVLGDNEVF